MQIKKLYIIIALCLFADNILLAQPYKFMFRHYSIENGLNSNCVETILSDSKGYIWIGTDNGLSKFDGTRFINYQKRNTNNALGNNSIICLLEHDNKLYIGTENGLFTYNYCIGQFNRCIKCIHSIVTGLAKDKKNNLWISTRYQGIFRITPQNGMKRYKLKSNETVSGVYSDHSGRLWATGSNAFYMFNERKGYFENFSINGKNNNIYCFALCEDSKHNFWVGTWDKGIIKLDVNRHTSLPNLGGYPFNKMLHIHSITEYKSGILLIGSDDGMVLYNTSTGDCKRYICDEQAPNSLSDQFIYPIVKDREGGLWIGTYYGGVNYVPPYCDQFEGYGPSEATNYIGGKIISRFYQDSNNNVWIASDDGGVSCFSTKQHRFINYFEKSVLSKVNAHAFCMDGNDLWIGTYSDGLIILNTKSGCIKKITGKHSPINGTSVYSLLKDKENRIWAGTMNGVSLYNCNNKQFAFLKSFGGLVIDIKEDYTGNIWFATQGDGLYKYNPTVNRWNHYGNQNDVLSTYINSICIDSKGKILVGTPEGLYSYQPKSDSFRYVPLTILNESINGIIEDSPHYWLTTVKGLINYTPGKEVKVFTQSDGLQSDNFVMSSGLKTKDGEIFVGTINGFNAFYPNSIRENCIKPTVVLTGIEVFNKEIPVNPKGILTAPPDQLKEIKFSHSDNVISIQYAALSYCTPDKNRYAYKLEGFDKDWNYVGNQTKATYTNLPAGKYVFHVKAANNDGVWNNEGASIKIVVHPPFYLTIPFKIMYTLLIIYIIYSTMHFIVKRNERRHKVELEKVQASKEKEVQEAKIQFFTTITHEIRTPLSLIIGPLEKVMQSTKHMPDSTTRNLMIIDRNSQRLLNLVNQLLDFRKVEQKELQLHYSSEDIMEIILSVSSRFTPYLDERMITLNVQSTQPSMNAIVDREAFIKIISNLLNNASKYAKKQIDIICKADTKWKTFTVSIKDDGIGMNENELSKIFKPFYQVSGNKPGTGIGLSIVKGLIDAHHGTISVKSAPGQGSEFTISLPLEQAGVTVMKREERQNDYVPMVETSNIQQESYCCAAKDKADILIVDDNEDMLEFLTDSLKSSYTLTCAKDGIDALEYLKVHSVSMIISDWMMPRMDGIELCKAIRSDDRISHIPFVLLTAKTDINSKITGMTCGADLYIEKPFSTQYLFACINNLIETRKQLRKKFSEMPAMPITSIANNSKDKDLLSRMNELIEENFSNPNLSIDFLAKELCVSRSGLFAKIKGVADATPNEMIQIIRLKKAAAMILENKYQINEICYKVGYNNPSYFAKCFQKQFGILPTEYFRSKEYII